jgi:hypothetical protein
MFSEAGNQTKLTPDLCFTAGGHGKIACNAAMRSRTGLVTNSICVESTIRDVAFRNYQCAFLSDGASEPIGMQEQRTNHDAPLLLIERLFGWASYSTAFRGALATA